MDGGADVGPVEVGGDLVGRRIAGRRDVEEIAAAPRLDAGLELAADLVRRLRRRRLGLDRGLALRVDGVELRLVRGADETVGIGVGGVHRLADDRIDPRRGEDDAAEPHDLAAGARVAVEDRLGEQRDVGAAVGLAGDEQRLRRELGMPFDEMDERPVPLVDAGLDVVRQRLLRGEGQAHAERVIEDQVVGGVVPAEGTVGERAVGVDRVRSVLGEEAPEAGRARPAIGPQDGRRRRLVGVLRHQPVEQPVLARAVAKHARRRARPRPRRSPAYCGVATVAIARQRQHPVVIGGSGAGPSRAATRQGRTSADRRDAIDRAGTKLKVRTHVFSSRVWNGRAGTLAHPQPIVTILTHIGVPIRIALPVSVSRPVAASRAKMVMRSAFWLAENRSRPDGDSAMLRGVAPPQGV